MDPDSLGSLYPDPEGKDAIEKYKTVNKFHLFLLSAGCSLLRAEGFSSSLDLLYGGLGISKLQFLIKKIYKNFQLYFLSSVFGHQNPGSVSGY